MLSVGWCERVRLPFLVLSLLVRTAWRRAAGRHIGGAAERGSYLRRRPTRGKRKRPVGDPGALRYVAVSFRSAGLRLVDAHDRVDLGHFVVGEAPVGGAGVLGDLL